MGMYFSQKHFCVMRISIPYSHEIYLHSTESMKVCILILCRDAQDPFVTLSICSQCVDISDSMVLMKDTEYRQYSLPGEKTAKKQTSIIGGQVTANVFETHHSNRIHSSNATAFLFAFARFGRGEKPVEAVECAVSFCAQVVKASVVNGKLSEESKFTKRQLLPSFPNSNRKSSLPKFLLKEANSICT